MAIKIRNAKTDDVELLFGWRTDAWSVKWSLSPAPGTMKEHKKWLDGVLQDRMQQLFVFEEEGLPIGTGRLQHAKTERRAVMSITVDPERRGQGFALKFIKRLITKGQQAGSHAFNAEVKVLNEPSLRAFLSAGFSITSADQDCVIALEHHASQD